MLKITNRGGGDYKSNILFNTYEGLHMKIFGTGIDGEEPSIGDLVKRAALYIAMSEFEEKKLNKNEVPEDYVEKRMKELIKSAGVKEPEAY